jgi:hypothetical protein
MQLLTLDELRAYLWVYWCLADAATGHPTPTKMIGRRERGAARRSPLTTDLAVRIREALPFNEKLDRSKTEAVVAKLHRLVADEVRSATSSTSGDTTATFQALLTNFSFPDGFPNDRPPRDSESHDSADDALLSGFVAANKVLWFRPASEESAELLGSRLDNPRTAFAERKTFTKKVLAFPRTERFRQWREDEINVAKTLSAKQKEVLRQFGVDARDILFRGTVIIGRDPRFTEVTWIGVRDNERYAELSDEQRGHLLTAAPECIRTLAIKTPARWVYSARVTEEIEELGPEEFNAFAVALGHHVITDHGGIVRCWPNYVKQGHVSESLRLERDEAVVVVSNSVTTEIEDAVIAALPSGFKGVVHILAREHLPGEVSMVPEIWSTHLGRDLPFAIMRPHNEQRLAALLLLRGRPASEGASISHDIEQLVREAATDYAALMATGECTGEEMSASALQLARGIDAVIRAHRHPQQPDTTEELARDQERWVRRLLLSDEDIFQREPLTFWLLLDNIALDLQSSTAAWHALLAENVEQFTIRLNATVRRIIFQRRMPVLETLERPEIAILPQTAEYAALEQHRAKQRELVDMMIGGIAEFAGTQEEHDALAGLRNRINTGWWEGTPQRDSVRTLQEGRTREALLAQSYLIQARHGQGISTSLYQIIRRLHPEAYVVTLTPSALVEGVAQKSGLFTDIVEHLLRERDVVITGTCNADDESIATRVTRDIEALTERFATAPHRAHFRFGLYYEAEPPTVWGTKDVRVITFGELGETYVEQLAAHVANTLGVELESGAAAALGKELRECDQAREIVRFFFTELPDNRLTLGRAQMALAPAPPNPWAEKALAIRSDVTREYELLVLQVIRCIEQLDTPGAPTYLVRLIVDDFAVGHSSDWRFKEGLHRLSLEGWIEDDKNWPIPPRYLRCLHPEWNLGDARLEVIKWLLTAPYSADEEWTTRTVRLSDWQKMLTKGADHVAWLGGGDPDLKELLKQVTSAVVPTLDPASEDVLTHAEALVDAGLLEDAARVMRGFQGDTRRARKMWMAIATKDWPFSRSIEGFLEALSVLDDDAIAEIVVRDPAWHAGSLELLTATARVCGCIPVVERLAAALEKIVPHEIPPFSERIPEYLAEIEARLKKSEELSSEPS